MNLTIFVLLAILLSAAALYAVAHPILARARSAQPGPASARETLDELLARREAAFQALRELAFDHRVGKITDEDFTAFEAHLKQTAADALRALDLWETDTDDALDRAMERAVQARRASIAASNRTCPACGGLRADDDRFCATCGHELSAAGAACPNCKRPVEAGDRFCAGCGQPLNVG
jgi:RNA polymerase subunit RPABC4/transcription elongation factor Spt4